MYFYITRCDMISRSMTSHITYRMTGSESGLECADTKPVEAAA
jgi:hypothetical protein